jgi:hypothetical protein
LIGLIGIGLFWGARLLIRKRPVPLSAATLPSGYVVEMSALRTEYSHYYGKPIEESALERRFRQAAELIAKRDYPGAASTLETLSRGAALPVVFSNLGVVYSALGDYARSADAFREVLARDADYAPARQFLKHDKSIPPNSADPYTREVEPNNEARTANLIGLGVPVSGEVTGNTDDVDYFRIITPAAPRDLLSVELANHFYRFRAAPAHL